MEKQEEEQTNQAGLKILLGFLKGIVDSAYDSQLMKPTSTEEPTSTSTEEPTSTSTEESTSTSNEEPTSTSNEESNHFKPVFDQVLDTVKDGSDPFKDLMYKIFPPDNKDNKDDTNKFHDMIDKSDTNAMATSTGKLLSSIVKNAFTELTSVSYPSEKHEQIVSELKSRFEQTSFDNIRLGYFIDIINELEELSRLYVYYDDEINEKTLTISIHCDDDIDIRIECKCLEDSFGTVKISMQDAISFKDIMGPLLKLRKNNTKEEANKEDDSKEEVSET